MKDFSRANPIGGTKAIKDWLRLINDRKEQRTLSNAISSVFGTSKQVETQIRGILSGGSDSQRMRYGWHNVSQMTLRYLRRRKTKHGSLYDSDLHDALAGTHVKRYSAARTHVNTDII